MLLLYDASLEGLLEEDVAQKHLLHGENSVFGQKQSACCCIPPSNQVPNVLKTINYFIGIVLTYFLLNTRVQLAHV